MQRILHDEVKLNKEESENLRAAIKETLAVEQQKLLQNEQMESTLEAFFETGFDYVNCLDVHKAFLDSGLDYVGSLGDQMQAMQLQDDLPDGLESQVEAMNLHDLQGVFERKFPEEEV